MKIDDAVLLGQMAQLFLMILCGYLLFRAKYLTVEVNRKLTRLLLDVTLPLMILSSVLKQEGDKDFASAFEVFGISIALYLILPVISYVLVKLMRFPKKQQGIYMFMNTYSNVGFMGFPVLNALYAEKAVFYAAILNIIFNLSLYTMGVMMIHYEGSGGEKSESGRVDLKLLLSPGLIGSAAAILFYFLPVSFPEPVVGAVDSIGGLTSPLAMILIGASLANMPLKEIFNDWRVYVFALVKQLVIPLLCWPVLKMAIGDTFIRSVIFILILMPVANSVVLFANNYEKDEALAAKNVFISTVFSVGTIPLAVYLISYL